MDVITWQTRPFERRKKARHNANHASMRAIFMLLFTPVNISFRKGWEKASSNSFLEDIAGHGEQARCRSKLISGVFGEYRRRLPRPVLPRCFPPA
jgi:hypothetical protein